VATGLGADEEVNVEGESMDMLITHRNVNIVAAIIAGSMAIWRFGLRRPSVAYLLTGVIGIGLFDVQQLPRPKSGYFWVG